MKVKILYTALISLIAGGAMAQDCTFFFPQTEGTVWVRKGYDAKGNLQSVMSYQVDEVETLPSGQEVEADYVYTNPSGTIVNKGDIKAYCQNGEFFLDSKETLSYPVIRIKENMKHPQRSDHHTHYNRYIGTQKRSHTTNYHHDNHQMIPPSHF